MSAENQTVDRNQILRKLDILGTEGHQVVTSAIFMSPVEKLEAMADMKYKSDYDFETYSRYEDLLPDDAMIEINKQEFISGLYVLPVETLKWLAEHTAGHEE
jgi:hypothetical protein